MISQFLKVLILAVIQGIAEFLPISSSGHLVVGKTLFQLNSPGTLLEIALHAGTLLSVCVFYAKDIGELVSGLFKGEKSAWRYAGAVLLSMIPCGLVYVFFGDRLESFFGKASWIGPFWILTGVLLLTMRKKSGDLSISPLRGLLIGIAQAVAMLPGVSRSGTTIWAAGHLHVKSGEAARFSFLMSVPVLAGAVLMMVKDVVFGDPDPSGERIPLWILASGALIAAVVGYLALSLLVRMLNRGRFWVFGIYCLVIGIAATLAFAL